MLAGVLAGCAAAPQTAAIEEGDNDPAEPVNRAVFDANMAADRAIMKPIAQAYQDYLPAEIRQSVHNASANLREPVVAANDLLQGRPARALNSAERFGINTTAGYAGVVDRAGQWNVPAHSADFDELERSSLDFYAALRSVYRQHRQSEIDKTRHDTGPGG